MILKSGECGKSWSLSFILFENARGKFKNFQVASKLSKVIILSEN